MNSAIAFVARLTVGKQLAAAAAFVHDKLDGHRSELAAGILCLVHALKLAGVLPVEQANLIESALAGILPLVLADRVSKVLKAADAVLPEPPASK